MPPAAVAQDLVTANCAAHQVPNPSSGLPQPTPGPLPFSAPLTSGLASQVLVDGRPAAVVGSAGTCTPPHVGLHASDPYVAPTAQRGKITSGEASVLVEGAPAATAASGCTACGINPGALQASSPDVLIGG